MSKPDKKVTLKYVYFVAYNLMTDKGLIVGNTASHADAPITSIEQVRDIERQLNDMYSAPEGCVSIVNFQFLNTITL